MTLLNLHGSSRNSLSVNLRSLRGKVDQKRFFQFQMYLYRPHLLQQGYRTNNSFLRPRTALGLFKGERKFFQLSFNNKKYDRSITSLYNSRMTNLNNKVLSLATKTKTKRKFFSTDPENSAPVPIGKSKNYIIKGNLPFRNKDFVRERRINLKKWADFKVWFPAILLNLGNIASLIGFAMTDFLALRCLTLFSGGMGFIYNITRSPPLYLPASWGLVFMAVNGYMTYNLIMEDKEISFTQEELDIFEEHFLPFGVSPTQFRKLIDCATWRTVPENSIIAIENAPLDELFLIAQGHVIAIVNNQKIDSFSTFPGARYERQRDAGAWIGEVNFMDQDKGRGAIATFKSLSETKYLSWNNNELYNLLDKDIALNKALSASIMAAVVGKILGYTSEATTVNKKLYADVVSGILTNKDEIVPEEKKLLRVFRKKHKVSKEEHIAIINDCGWTSEEYEDGSKVRHRLLSMSNQLQDNGLLPKYKKTKRRNDVGDKSLMNNEQNQRPEQMEQESANERQLSKNKKERKIEHQEKMQENQQIEAGPESQRSDNKAEIVNNDDNFSKEQEKEESNEINIDEDDISRWKKLIRRFSTRSKKLMNAIDLSAITPKAPFGELLSKTTTTKTNMDENITETKSNYQLQVEQEHVIEDAFALIQEEEKNLETEESKITSRRRAIFPKEEKEEGTSITSGEIVDHYHETPQVEIFDSEGINDAAVVATMKEKEHKANLKKKLGALGKKKKKKIGKSTYSQEDLREESSMKTSKENDNFSKENSNIEHKTKTSIEDEQDKKEGKEQLLRRTTRCLDENIINTKPKHMPNSIGKTSGSSES